MARYALFDTVDKLWIGDDAGPRTIGGGDLVEGKPITDEDAHFLARCMAEAACHTVRWDVKRIEVREAPAGPWRIIDEVEKTRTELDWIIRKERGAIL